MRKALYLFSFVFIVWCLSVAAEEELKIFKKVDLDERSFYLELLMENPTKEKIERNVDSLVRQYGKRSRLQIDIFDNLETLQRRHDETYPTNLVYRHWLISITNEGVYRFYLKERPDIK